MWDDWHISISQSEIKIICEYFEAAGSLALDPQITADIQKNGKIILSVDGAQPIKGEPALWVFRDRLSGHVVSAKMLEKATAELLCETYQDIENKFNTPIVAVISDKQSNIVKATQLFRPSLIHVYCQFHFLNHIVSPVASKDSHLSTELREKIRKFSLLQGDLSQKKPDSVHSLFSPIREELLCAIATTGDRFKIFPGIEMYRNLDYIKNQLMQYQSSALPQKIQRTLSVLIDGIQSLLTEYSTLYTETVSLIQDFEQIRQIMAQRDVASVEIKKQIRDWIQILRERLESQQKQNDPDTLKWQKLNYESDVFSIYQEWIRLEHSYHDGIYHA
jgi:hypothetical protein